MEQIIRKKLIAFLEENNLLNYTRCGFCPNRNDHRTSVNLSSVSFINYYYLKLTLRKPSGSIPQPWGTLGNPNYEHTLLNTLIGIYPLVPQNYVCVCVRVDTHIRTHPHINMYIHLYICKHIKIERGEGGRKRVCVYNISVDVSSILTGNLKMILTNRLALVSIAESS